MALTKKVIDDKIEIVGEYKQLQIRTKSVIEEDGVEISSTFNRRTLNPGDLDKDNNLVDTDLSSESSEVRSIANIVWTDAVKTSWKNLLIAELPKGFTP